MYQSVGASRHIPTRRNLADAEQKQTESREPEGSLLNQKSDEKREDLRAIHANGDHSSSHLNRKKGHQQGKRGTLAVLTIL
jgi:hypothetical protein